MFLKRIDMKGFKSFAEKVTFDFGPGVTCIVGPNGCGKSNVVDAFRWVLGEQSAKSLRGKQMQDMIFNGSGGRKAAAFAEVNLVFDNTDRSLALDTDEVAVCRRLYRSGESEYSLCGQTSRLKDIRELFLDTGVGTEAYSVIEQGKVEILLQASPQERRMIFEEAAGISKYKVRRKEAERKLDRTQQNLLRVEDVIEELGKRLRSVKYQAGKARNYKEYEERLKELRASFSMAEYHRHTQAIDNQVKKCQEISDEVTALRTRIDANEAEASQLTTRTDALTEELSGAESELIRVRSDITANQERISSSERRIEEQKANRDRALAQVRDGNERVEQMQTQLTTAEEQHERLTGEIEEQHQKVDELHEQDRKLAHELTQAKAILEDEKAGIIELLRRTAHLHNEIEQLNSHQENLVGQKGRLFERDEQIRGELRELLEQKAEIESRIAEIDSLIEQETTRLEEKKVQAEQVDSEKARLAHDLAEVKEERTGLQSRRQVLDDLERKMEGVGKGILHILSRKTAEPDSAGMSSVVGIVGDLLTIDVKDAPIIEAAIGELDQYLVVSNSGEFLSGMGNADELPGRLNMICQDKLPPLVNVRDFSSCEGFVARAIDLVKVSGEYERLARHLLAKTIVVRTLADGMAMARNDYADHRFVTLAGEIVEPNGTLEVGPRSASTGLISRRSELRSIETRVGELDVQIEQLSENLERTSAEAAHLADIQHELRTAIYESNAARVESNARLNNIEESIGRLTREQPIIAGEVEMIENQLHEAAEKASQREETLGITENESETRQAEVTRHEDRIESLTEQRNVASSELTQARVLAAQLTEKKTAAADTIASLQRIIQSTLSNLKSAEAEASACDDRIAESEELISACREKLEGLNAEANTLDERVLSIKQEREKIRVQAEELAEATRNCRTALTEAEANHHEAEVALNESRIRRDELTQRVRDELGIHLEELYKEYDESDEQDWVAVEEEIAELRKKIQRLGNVNLDAIDELQELEERHEFLTTQQADLNQSIGELEKLIQQLNQESKRRFEDAFNLIRENFQELFRKLFGGGKADIVLEDPEEILDCGIEIIARPPNKEPQSISLLSGGEKAMTAIALLMAIFRSRPAPFAILDEVDAPLDEANNERFNGIIREFLDRSQFIVITHSKRTMSIGDRMYGVTMQEAGVSTPVSVNFDNHEQGHAVA